ncbi:MAG TPA: DegT/DnrJ/EryC1/StrS aminotransferase family protein [Candidatus Nitrosopolaris sp.]|nr:DegT/DnrJ/EryC1/StrS aminotransferase family protein [Candidatus Nitrosopolaris sp.]
MIPINQPCIGDEEKREVLSVLDENALTSAAKNGGKRVQALEQLLKDYLKVQNVVSVNSGTAALYSALLALGIGEGDEVLLPSFTFVATANSVVAAGAKPIFVDINREDYTIDIADLKTKITKNSKAIIPVHLYGHPADMDEISEISYTHSLDIIEDACQSLGSLYRKTQTGTLGKLGCFSFYASKVLTAGEGGAVATNDDNLANNIKLIRNHGMVEGYDTRVLGLNLRLPELSAALAKAQMDKLQKLLDSRRRNASRLTDLLHPLSKKGRINIPHETEKKRFNWYLYTVAFQEESIREKVRRALASDKIGSVVYYNPPVHKTPYYQKIASTKNLPNTDWASEHVLSLPVHSFVSAGDLERIATSIEKAF